MPATKWLECPKCGGTYFRRVYSVKGTWSQLLQVIDGKVDVVDTDVDQVVFKREPKFISCGDCRTKVPNPKHNPQL